MYTDTHCHVIPLEYSNVSDIINNLSKNNVKRIIINGYNLESNKEVLDLCNKYPNVYGALGMHPDNISEDIDLNLEFINENVSNSKIVAIGEIGLDYFHNKENKKEQIKLFESLLDLAENVNKPVIIHTRDATDDTIRILKQHHNKGIIHSFTGSSETAREYIKLSFKLGINGVLTFKNSKLSETLKNIDIHNILLETDSPYLTPEPFRGHVNEPKHIRYIFDKVCQIYNLSDDDLNNILEANLHEVFDIDK